jgi:hypothetical protein
LGPGIYLRNPGGNVKILKVFAEENAKRAILTQNGYFMPKMNHNVDIDNSCLYWNSFWLSLF